MLTTHKSRFPVWWEFIIKIGEAPTLKMIGSTARAALAFYGSRETYELGIEQQVPLV